MICVIDSSVWVSGFQFNGVPLQALDYAFRAHRIAVCNPILHEIHTTLTEKFNWSHSRIEGVLSEYLTEALHIAIHSQLFGICRDPKDDVILECAIVASAELIVTGDKDLLALGEYEGIRILTPRAFLDEFSA